MLIRKSDPLIFAFLAGCVMGLIVGIAIHDFSMAAHAAEKSVCRDEPDRKAYMLRLPGESHSVEHCEKVMRYGDPAWIPYMSSPLRGRE